MVQGFKDRDLAQQHLTLFWVGDTHQLDYLESIPGFGRLVFVLVVLNGKEIVERGRWK